MFQLILILFECGVFSSDALRSLLHQTQWQWAIPPVTHGICFIQWRFLPGLLRNAIFVIGLLLWITRSPLRVIGRGPGPTSTLSAHWLPLAARNHTFPPEVLEMQLTRQDMRRATWKPFPHGPVSSSRPLECVPTASQPNEVPRKRDVCKLTRVTRFFCSKHGSGDVRWIMVLLTSWRPLLIPNPLGSFASSTAF